MAAARLHAVLPEGDPNRLREDAVWVQIAAEGSYEGHHQGEFELTREVFEKLQENLRRHPSYRAGEDGWGEAGVIAWDFHHESEKHGSQLAVVGAPAQGWTLDLDVRDGEKGVELWSLTRFLEPALSYVRDGRYQWSSMAIWPDAVDPVTGESIGWYLSSVALTNDPFIQGMAPLAAERVGGVAASRIWLESGELDVDALMSEMRWIFGLSETDGVAEAAAELNKLATIVSSPDTAPAGVDVGGLVGRLRQLLNLPILTPTAEVLAYAQQLIQRLVSPDTSAPVEADRGRGRKTCATQQRMNEKLLALCRLLALSATITNDDEAIDAIRREVESMRIKLEQSSEARSKLEAIGKLFGVDDPGSILDSVTAVHADLEQLKSVVPEIAEMLAGQADTEDKMAEEDVEAAMAAHRMPPTAKPALLAFRTGGLDLEKRSEVLRVDRGKSDKLRKDLESRRAQRAKFLEKYPLPQGATQHLLQSFGQPPPLPGAPPPPPGMQPAHFGGQHGGQPPAPPAPSGGAIDLSRFTGRNITEQAMAYVASQPGGDKLSFDERWQAACELVRAQRQAAMGGLH